MSLLPNTHYENRYAGRRICCDFCRNNYSGGGKVVFPDQRSAERAAERISRRTPMWAYKARCGYWHLTTKKTR